MASQDGRNELGSKLSHAAFNDSRFLEIALDTLSGPSQNANINNSDDEVFFHLLKQPTHMVLLYSLAYALVFVSALVGNLMVMAVVARNPALHSVTNYFLINLSVADVLVALFCVPVNLIMTLYSGWQLGAFMCKAAPYLQGVSVCASVNTLATIALDRYFAICHVMNVKISRRKCKVIIFFIWATALGIMTPWFVYYQCVPYATSKQVLYVCYEDWPSSSLRRAYHMGVIFVCCYSVPLIMITFCYALIVLKVSRRHELGARNSSTRLIQQSKVKVIKMLVVVCALFAFSWMPLYSISFWRNVQQEFNSDTEQFVSETVIPVAQWFGCSNCCMNPIIYCFFSKKFRAGFREIMACCSCVSVTGGGVKGPYKESPENTIILRNGSSPRYTSAIVLL